MYVPSAADSLSPAAPFDKSNNDPLTSLSIRVFDDPSTGSMWKSSVKDISGEVLCVSQFTLFANTQKGNKPDFHRAMVSSRGFIWIFRFNVDALVDLRLRPHKKAETSQQMYESFLTRMGQLYNPEMIKGEFLLSLEDRWSDLLTEVLNLILDGKFGAMMNVSLTNDVRSSTLIFKISTECLIPRALWRWF